MICFRQESPLDSYFSTMFKNVWFDQDDGGKDEPGKEFIVHPVDKDDMKKMNMDIQTTTFSKAAVTENKETIDEKMNKYLFRI